MQDSKDVNESCDNAMWLILGMCYIISMTSQMKGVHGGRGGEGYPPWFWEWGFKDKVLEENILGCFGHVFFGYF